MIPTEEQVKEFWEWCGFGDVHYNSLGAISQKWSGRKKPYGEWYYLPIDLNNLDRWAVPKVLEKYDLKIFSFYDDLNDKVFWFVHAIDREKTDEVEFANIEGCEELKDALFEVLYEVIHESH